VSGSENVMINDKDLVKKMATDQATAALGTEFVNKTAPYKYSYNFSWLGRPIIQFPQDMVAVQELIWSVRPDVVIETGIAHGGSLVFHASILHLLGGNGRVVGIDIDIRQHNREAIEKHPMFERITMIEGSSVDETVAARVKAELGDARRVMVLLDSNHTHDHVLKELQLYSPLVTKDSYLIVFDTVVEDMPPDAFPDRPWGKGNNPKTAVLEFLQTNERFEIDKEIEDRLLITVAPSGYLKCVKDDVK
jgi:cephalosporin hydroxylase